MISQKQKTPSSYSFFIIIFTALLVQLVGSYYAKYFIIGGSFYLLWVLLRILVPVLVIMLMRMPFPRMGLGVPRIDRNMGRILIIGVVILIAVFAGIYFLQGYFAFYSNSFNGQGGLARFAGFMIFTGSTLTGWEFLHRSFLLMGLVYVLTEREKVPAETAAKIAVAVVWIFEVVFHFIKPELEALGMLAGSPILSWLALRTRSIWPPFLIHVLVELLFIAALIMR